MFGVLNPNTFTRVISLDGYIHRLCVCNSNWKEGGGTAAFFNRTKKKELTEPDDDDDDFLPAPSSFLWELTHSTGRFVVFPESRAS